MNVEVLGADYEAVGADNLLGKSAFLSRLKKIAKRAVKFTPPHLRMFRGDEVYGYGDDASTGSFRLNPSLKAALARTVEGQAILEHLGDDELGKFLPGLMKVVRNVGKITSKVTTAIAKTVLPGKLVDALAKADPTTHTKFLDKVSDVASQAKSALASSAVKVEEKIGQAASAESRLVQKNPAIAIGIAAAVVVAGVAFLSLRKR